MDGLTKNVNFTTMEKQGVPLQHMSVVELLELKHQIDGYLPALSLKDVNLEAELLQQFALVKDLQTGVLTDDMIPANQKAQVAGQVASTLQQLVKMQTDYYNAERFKSVENIMISALKKLPLDAANEFLKEYENLGQ
jgi:hypothetical protein